MRQKTTAINLKLISTIAITLFAIALFFTYATKVIAAPPTNRSDLMTSLSASTTSSHDISFTLTGATTFAATETITIDFDEDGSEWVVDGASAAIADFDFNDGTERVIYAVNTGAADCTGSVGVNDVAVGIDDTTGVVTFLACSSMTASGAGATVNIEIGTAAGGTDRITNPTAAEYQLTIAGTYGDDSADIAIDIVADDEVVVTATVDETMNFAINDNLIGFGTLSSSAARYATANEAGSASETEAHTIIVGTNASGGYTLTVNGTTLTSGSDTITAIGDTNTASATGTEQFGLRATASGGTGTVSAPYAAAGFALDTGAFPDELAAATAGSDDTTYSMRYLANIGSSTEAGAYTANLTYIATGTF